MTEQELYALSIKKFRGGAMSPYPGGAWYPADQFGTCEVTAEKNALASRSTDGKIIDWFESSDEDRLEQCRQEVYRTVRSAKLGIVYFPTYAMTVADAVQTTPTVAGLRSPRPETTSKPH